MLRQKKAKYTHRRKENVLLVDTHEVQFVFFKITKYTVTTNLLAEEVFSERGSTSQ
jgi:hypothetical protein